jgi:hypothetical protein
MKTKLTVIHILICSFFCDISLAQMQRLKVDETGHFILKEDGSAFIWMAATLWDWNTLSFDEVKAIIDDHAARGFTVFQLEEKSPSPMFTNIVEYLHSKNMYAAINLYWHSKGGSLSASQIYNDAYQAGLRFGDYPHIIWLGIGEFGCNNRGSHTDLKAQNLVNGLREGDMAGDGHAHLITIHGDYRRGSSCCNDENIVDFLNWQTSQWPNPDLARGDPSIGNVWDAMSHDYNHTYNGKHKPTIDIEAWYENNYSNNGCDATAFVQRRRLYVSIFAGGLVGWGYGAGGIWDGNDNLNEGCSRSWEVALTYPGYHDVGHAARFLQSFGDDSLKLRPDQSIIKSSQGNDMQKRTRAVTAIDGSFAIVYDANGGSVNVDLTGFAGGTVELSWFNPREGTYTEGGTYTTTSSNQHFTAPGNDDWVLVLEAD